MSEYKIATVHVNGVRALALDRKDIPVGIKGAVVTLAYEWPFWDELEKHVVFQGATTVAVPYAGEVVEFPPEVAAVPNVNVRVGVYGLGKSGEMSIPTLWADLGVVKHSAHGSFPPPQEQALPVWAQVLGRIGDLENLETNDKENLVAAINEVLSKVGTGGGNVDLSGYAKEEWVNRQLEGYQPAGNYALKDEIPVIPVQSVNGKTGTVQLSASDVGARPDNWMPTAQDVGALPSTYTPPDQTAEQVGADPKGTAESAVSQHNTADDSHGDIRLELKAINDRLTAFFDSDNQTLDELSEIVAYITSNKSLIDAITTSKVSVADIINNLTTNVSNKPLSAAQGVVLKSLIDTLSGNLANYQPKGDYALRSELPTVPTKVSAFTNDAGYLTKHQDISGKVDKDKLTLGRDASGLLYLYIDGLPAGAGIELPTGGIDGYITEDKQIIFNNLPDGEYTLAYIAEDGSIVPIGALEKDTNVYYTVKNTLTNCTSNNSATQAVQGGSYSATITAKSGYEMSSIKVTMGGTDITASAVSGGKITISNVTGNIVINAVAEEIKAAYTNILTSGDYEIQLNKRWSSSGKNYSACNGMISFMIPVADVKNKTIYFKGFPANGTASSQQPLWFALDANNARLNGLGGTSNGNVWTSTLLTTDANGVSSILIDTNAFESLASAANISISMNVNTSAAITTLPDTLIMTIDEPIA